MGSKGRNSSDLIPKDQERKQKIAALQSLIDDGLDSGVSMRSMKEVLAEARQRAHSTGAV